MTRRHNNNHQGKHRETRNGSKRNDEETGERRVQTTSKKMRILQKLAEWVGHKSDQDGLTPLQDKLEANQK